MIINPNKAITILISEFIIVVSIFVLRMLKVEILIAVSISIIIGIFFLFYRYRYFRRLNNELVSRYIKEYVGEDSAIKYFRKTLYARKNKLADKDVIYNYELRQMPKILQSKGLNKRISREMINNHVKLSIISPYIYKVKYINLVLVTNTIESKLEDYIKDIRKDYLEEGTENIVLFYLENPTNEEYKVIRREMYVNNYRVDDINLKLTFLVKDDKGFTLLSNYYFVDFSSDMIKEKFRIESDVPIPCDILTQRVNNEILYKICGI